MPKLFVNSIIFCAIVLLAPNARANQNETHSLSEAISVNPGATCLDGLTLIQHVRKWLEQDEIDRQVYVKVEGDTISSEKAQVTIDKGDGYPNRSTFESSTDTCAEFHSALGLSIAMAITATVIEPPLSELGLSKDNQRAQLTLQTLGTFDVLVDFAAGWSGRFEAFYEWLVLRAGVAFMYSDNQVVDKKFEATFDILLIAGRIDLCAGAEPFSRFRLSGCAGITAGPFRTVGHNLERGEASNRAWAAAIFGIDMIYDLSDIIGISVSADLLHTLWRREIEVYYDNGELATFLPLSNLGVIIGVGPIFVIN